MTLLGWKRRALQAEDDVRVLKLVQRLRPWANSQWVATVRARDAEEKTSREAARRPLPDLWPIPKPRAASDAEATVPLRPLPGRR